jgi:hypothetical protein
MYAFRSHSRGGGAGARPAALRRAARRRRETLTGPALDRLNAYHEHSDQVIGKLVRMIENPHPWLIVSDKAKVRCG